MTSLTDRLDNFPEAWRPKPGDKLIGTVSDVDSRESEYQDEPYPIVVVEADEGSTEESEPISAGTEKAWHAFHTMARGEVAKRQPAIGDKIGIAYHGPSEKAAAGMQPAERWRLIIDERGPGHTPPAAAAPEPEPKPPEPEPTAAAADDDDGIPF